MHTSGYRGATAARSVTRGCGPRERGRRLRFDSAPPSNGVIDRLIRTPHGRCDDAPAPATRVAPDRAQRPPKLWLRANTSRHKAMSHGGWWPRRRGWSGSAPRSFAVACGWRARTKPRRRRAGRKSAAGRRGRPRSAYEAPRATADRSTRFSGAESKRRGCPRLPAPPSRVTLLVPVVLRLVRPLGGDADVGGLLGGEPGERDAQLLQVQARHLLVELLGEHVDRLPVPGGVPPQLELRQH